MFLCIRLLRNHSSALSTQKEEFFRIIPYLYILKGIRFLFESIQAKQKRDRKIARLAERKKEQDIQKGQAITENDTYEVAEDAPIGDPDGSPAGSADPILEEEFMESTEDVFDERNNGEGNSPEMK